MGRIRRLGAGAAIGAMATGLVGGALDHGAAAAAQETRLTASIALVGQSSAEGVGFARYTVTIRSVGGTACGTQVAISQSRLARLVCTATPTSATPSASAASPATAATPAVTPRKTAQAYAGRERIRAAHRPVPPVAQRSRAPRVRPMPPPRLSPPSTPSGPWLPALDPQALFVAPPIPVVPTAPGGLQVPDDSSQMSLNTMPQAAGGRDPWARALAVVVVAEAAVLWLAASLGLWQRRLLPGHAVGNGVRNARLLRPAAALLRRVPRVRVRLGARVEASSRWLRFRR